VAACGCSGLLMLQLVVFWACFECMEESHTLSLLAEGIVGTCACSVVLHQRFATCCDSFGCLCTKRVATCSDSFGCLCNKGHQELSPANDPSGSCQLTSQTARLALLAATAEH